jgi:hypothetical protein
MTNSMRRKRSMGYTVHQHASLSCVLCMHVVAIGLFTVFGPPGVAWQASLVFHLLLSNSALLKGRSATLSSLAPVPTAVKLSWLASEDPPPAASSDSSFHAYIHCTKIRITSELNSKVSPLESLALPVVFNH